MTGRTTSSSPERVRRILDDTTMPITPAEVADQTGIPRPIADRVLRKTHEAGYVVAVTRGDAVAYHRDD